MSAEVAIGVVTVRLSIIIKREAEESGEVWTPISLQTAIDPLVQWSVNDVGLAAEDEVAAASAADLVRLAHLKTCVCRMM